VKKLVEAAAVVVGVVPMLLVMATVAGLGLHRQGHAWAIAASSVVLLLGPPVLATALVGRNRGLVFGAVAGAWSTGIFLALPVYFPGERADAMITGLSLGSRDVEPMARALAGAMPPEPELAQPEEPVADTLVVQPVPPPRQALAEHQIALPYEGDGRRMSVEIAVQHGGRSQEIQLLLDTGATYTTLPAALLAELGVHPRPEDPVITLHTANGEREARIVLLDKLWLGDLQMQGVAIATCDVCASEDNLGLLGLNVTGGYNLNIDADRQEVVFTRRADYSRHLDVKPFVDVGATVTRLPGRVTVVARLQNNAPRAIASAKASIHCRDQTWLVDLPPTPAGKTTENEERLPSHEPCDRYQVGLHSAEW
jgi:hypothetical protein